MDYKIMYLNLPESVKGFVVPGLDDFYTIVINIRHSAHVQQETIRHELAHIHNHDFEKYDVGEIELQYK